MRLLVTADLHYNHTRSRPLADDVIDRMNRAGGDVLLVVGDTASPQGDYFERCLAKFKFAGPKLIVAGNHELWSPGADSHAILLDDLPRRAANLGWHWLQTKPFIADDIAIVGSIGWYDYSFAATDLAIPRRFYEHKISPGSAIRVPALTHLFNPQDDIPPRAKSLIARWNDGRFIRLGRSDEQFLSELRQTLEQQLISVASAKTVIAAIHHLPFRQLLPPSHSAQWDFAKAYLGSENIGKLLLQHPNVARVFCGHSHFPAECVTQQIRATNIGSSYRHKTFWIGDV